MSEPTSRTILFYTLIAIGFQLNSKIRRIINKYYLQDILDKSTLVANRTQHISDAIGAFSKIALSLIADFILGPYITFLILFPTYIISFATNILSAVCFSGARKAFFYMCTFYTGVMINDALFIIYIPFVKVQLNNKKLFEQFLDTWYMIFNIMNTLVSLIAPLVFKNWIGVNYSNIKFLIFVIPPLIITALSFIIFLLNRKAYIIKSIDRTAIKNFFLMIFKKNKTQTRIQIRDRNTRLKCVIGLLIVMMFYCVVTDQFNTMIVDFTDSSRLSNFSLFGISMKPCGSSLMSINGITVVLVTPVMFYFIYPYVIAKWSIYRKLCFAILLNQLSLFLGLSLHMINIQRDCIDSTFSPHFTWYIIPWVMNAISELIIFPITVKTITSVAPPDYVSFCTCLLWSTNGFASIFCYVINLFKLSEIIRCIIFITVCIVAFPIIYFAFSNEKQISVPEDINKEKSVFEKCE